MNVPYGGAKKKSQYPGKVDKKLLAAFAMKDMPAIEGGQYPWIGYFRFKDKTQLPGNCLTFPSINCFIPFRDKIVPRKSSTLLGQPFTPNQSWPIIGHQKRFTTMGGFEVEIRVEKTNDANLKDVIKILYPNPVTGVLQWYQITENVNPNAAGVHEYYFDSWFDTNLNPAKSLNLPRSVWVNGLNVIFTWSGGIAHITAINPGISLTTAPGTTWASLGFVDPSIDPSSSGKIVVNGVAYQATGGWATDTLLVTSTAGISINDVATSQIQADTYDSTLAFDVCRQNKNYMFYGSWKSRQLFMSNGFGHDSSALITTAQAVQNDLVVDPSPYTGTGSHVYRVTIDSVHISDQVFTPGGSGNLNDGTWITTGYTGPINVVNKYSIVIVGDYLLDVTIVTGGPYVLGETVQGSGSKAQGIIIKYSQVGAAATIGIKMITPETGFDITDTITGFSSGTTGTVTANSFLTSFEVIKNGIIFPVNMGFGTQDINYFFGSTIPQTGTIDGLTFKFVNTFGHAVGDTFTLTINGGVADTFQWQIDGAIPVATHVPITGSPQALSLGISITFVNQSGHTLGDYWEITVDQAVVKAWTNFYYTLPIRKPGEGYIYRLSENFWTMAPQEAEMYVNTQYGRWSYVETILSANQQSESVSLTPLKQSSMSKVIFPYMISDLDNDLIFVTTDKKLDLIGRKELVQLPQISSLSQPVQFDFDEATFLKGSMEYWNKTLWITSPQGGVMFCYDDHPENKYWQPPQVIPENGILSIVGNSLISHSNIRNQTFTLFNGTSGDTQEDLAFTVRARRPYDCKGQRWNSKNSTMSFVEGYITGAPPMELTVIQEINGCKGIFPHDIKPVVCIPPDRAPLGEGEFGSHQMGSDNSTPDAYFQEIYEQFNPILSYYFYALELSCRATNHSYEWLSFELNQVSSNTNNMPLKNVKPILPALP